MVRLEELLKQGTRDEFDPNKHKRVGSYVLGRSLGEGSFAKVRLGVHVLTKEKVINYSHGWGSANWFQQIGSSIPLLTAFNFVMQGAIARAILGL